MKDQHGVNKNLLEATAVIGYLHFVDGVDGKRAVDAVVDKLTADIARHVAVTHTTRVEDKHSVVYNARVYVFRPDEFWEIVQREAMRMNAVMRHAEFRESVPCKSQHSMTTHSDACR